MGNAYSKYLAGVITKDDFITESMIDTSSLIMESFLNESKVLDRIKKGTKKLATNFKSLLSNYGPTAAGILFLIIVGINAAENKGKAEKVAIDILTKGDKKLEDYSKEEISHMHKEFLRNMDTSLNFKTSAPKTRTNLNLLRAAMKTQLGIDKKTITDIVSTSDGVNQSFHKVQDLLATVYKEHPDIDELKMINIVSLLFNTREIAAFDLGIADDKYFPTSKTKEFAL